VGALMHRTLIPAILAITFAAQPAQARDSDAQIRQLIIQESL